MMNRSDKFKLKKGLVRMHRISWMAIVLFLVISLIHYLGIEPRPTGTILLIKCLVIFIGIGGMKNLLGVVVDGASDGVDLPGVDL